MIDLTQYNNQWVALNARDRTHVIASNKELEILRQDPKLVNYEVVYYFMHDKSVYFCGNTK